MLAQQELARSISRLCSSQAELQSAEAQLQSAQDEQRSAPRDTLGAVELQSRQAFIERIEARRSQRVLETQRSEAEVAARNAELLRAAGEHEMLNRLRERRKVEHERDAALREGKILDEMASSRTHRRTRMSTQAISASRADRHAGGRAGCCRAGPRTSADDRKDARRLRRARRAASGAGSASAPARRRPSPRPFRQPVRRAPQGASIPLLRLESLRRTDRTGGAAQRGRPGDPARPDPAGVGLRPQRPEQRGRIRPDPADARHRLLARRRQPAEPGRIDRRRRPLPQPDDGQIRRQHQRGAGRLQRRPRGRHASTAACLPTPKPRAT